MPVYQTITRTSTTYVAGMDLENAQERAGDHRFYGSVVKDTSQEAYDALGYFEKESDAEYEVFEFHVVETITQVTPPYSR